MQEHKNIMCAGSHVGGQLFIYKCTEGYSVHTMSMTLLRIIQTINNYYVLIFCD